MQSFYEWIQFLENKKTILAPNVVDYKDVIEDLLDDIKHASYKLSWRSGVYQVPSQEELKKVISVYQKKLDNELEKWKKIFGEDYPGTGDFEVVDGEGGYPGMADHWRDMQMWIKNGRKPVDIGLF